MGILLEEITKRIEKRNNKCERAFLLEISEIIDQNNDHLDEITGQMRNYDKHNKVHSEKVLNNIELLLGENTISRLSFYELIILYLSAYLHDSAMALPRWEYNLLRSVEGNKDVLDTSCKVKINNDFKPCQKLEDIVEFIKTNRDNIYGDFNTIKNFVFAFQNENKFQYDLAHRVIDYEDFRNSYSKELKKYLNDTAVFLEYSELLREEFIRITHHTRAVVYINNLKDPFSVRLGKVIADEIINALAQVCQSHGEDINFIYNKQKYNNVINNEQVNTQFLSVILRLADIIHFSADRAPLSLYAEKLITNYTSINHWTAKFQDLSYKIKRKDDNINIEFKAFCSTPEIYYFIQDYMDWIDKTLFEYHSYIKYLQSNKFSEIDKYIIPLCHEVNRADILADKEKFVPDVTLKFTLEQEQILKLLMGVQLYKDKFLCLRELYQNSLDACKCMEAINTIGSKVEKLYIKFGISEQNIDGKNQKYIYCMDNGTGMTEDIVKKYLLHIGNSFYNSKEFAKLNTNWNNVVKPISQFGIGILSCYMIADKIEIITKKYDNKIFSLVMDGVSKKSYYISPDEKWVEKIGEHGTLVKLFLKADVSDLVSCAIPNNFWKLVYSRHSNLNNKEHAALIDSLKKSLFYLVNNQVGIPKDNIAVSVLAGGEYKPIISWVKLLSDDYYKDISKIDIENAWSQLRYIDGSFNPYKKAIACLDNVEDIPIKVTDNNIEIYTYLTLPIQGYNCDDYRIFAYRKTIWQKEGSFLVDGISVNFTGRINPEDRLCLLNFIGDKRPVLSIDRNSIVSISKSISDEIALLYSKLVDEIANTLVHHLFDKNIPFDSELADISVKAVINRFPMFSTRFLLALIKNEGKNIKINAGLLGKMTIQSLVQSNTMVLDDFDMRAYNELYREILVGKLVTAEKVKINAKQLSFETSKFEPLDSIVERSFDRSLALTSVVIKADEWKGKFEEYDIVSNLWPIISPSLYNIFDGKVPSERFNKRAKFFQYTGNGLAGIAGIDPVMIHDCGIYSLGERPFANRKPRGLVGETGSLLKEFWLFEINSWGELINKEKKDYVLFVYISPRKLNDFEKKQLADYQEDSDYVKGVREGWSILFIGHECKYYIKAGIVSREEMYKMIPRSLRENKRDNITYIDVKGNTVF